MFAEAIRADEVWALSGAVPEAEVMQRRSFLKLLGMGAVGAVAVPMLPALPALPTVAVLNDAWLHRATGTYVGTGEDMEIHFGFNAKVVQIRQLNISNERRDEIRELLYGGVRVRRWGR